MSKLIRLSLTAVFSASLLLGCGLTSAPNTKATTRGGQVDSFGTGHTDDSDLSGGGMMAEGFGDNLRKEAIAKLAQGLVFRTQIIAPMTGRSVLPSKGPNPSITGVLRYPDFSGKLIPAANVTVHIETKGLMGSKAVASVVTDASGRWTADVPADMAGKAVNVSYELGNKYWTINKYRWAGAAIEALQPVNDTGERTLMPDSENGQAALIHQIWNRALATFEKEGIPLDWWSKRIGTNWPASGDFYSMGTVNLTDAKQWDVNGHEIGHSMFFAAFNSAGGGGQHKIDECYGADLAWSEGFASFFSGVISVGRNDPDAKFEYMVPRRKPIRLENVPADVCEGHTNEWRVSAALWDVYDTHDDGTDHVAVDFKTIWGALVRTNAPGRMSDVRDAIKRIAVAVPATERAGLSEAFAQSGVPVTLQVANRK
jgi:hypothetical protein